MILDQQIRADISEQWDAVKRLCRDSHRQYQTVGAMINETPPESFYNLPFLLAYAVLDQVLAELVEQGNIACPGKRPLLGQKMAASQNVLPWQDYALVDQGKTARNDLAHKATLLPKRECFRFIDAIETELTAWQVL